MKNAIKILAMFAVIASAATANAQTSASTGTGTNPTGTAIVIVPITIAKTADMNLGTIVADATLGSLTIASTGARTFTNSNNHLPHNTNGTPAAFDVTGDASCTFAMSRVGNGSNGSALGFNLTNGTPANDMWFAFDNTANTGHVLTGGAASYKVAGTLSIAANQPSGTYTGSWVETVSYE